MSSKNYYSKLKSRRWLISLFVIFIFLSFFIFNLLKPTQPTPAQAQTESAIAIRVFKNPEHLSPEQWYKENVPHPANPQSTVIDGYQAIRDGRSVYVSAANLNTVDNKLYSNIYLISYSEGASATAQKIFEGVLANWQFNSNILPDNAGKVCSNDYTTVCSQDKDCPQGETCLNKEPKPRLIRDVKRLADLQDIRQELEDYNYQAGSFPTLSSGTYIPKLSFSVWPSWEKTLGQSLSSTLPADPINRLMGCTNPYDPTTCWDNKTLAFQCPGNYYIYAYQSPTSSGDQAKLYTKLEYRDQSWASTLDILTNPQELLANCQLNFGQDTNDYDNDTVPNGDDNCPTIPNTTQADADNDKIGNACDACPNDAQNDQDNDGYCVGLASLVFGDKKSNDNCPTVYNPSQQGNPSLPGIGLACSRCLDADHDRYCSYETGGDDCDDRPNGANGVANDYDDGEYINPETTEKCNNIDDDCDGKIDEGCDDDNDDYCDDKMIYVTQAAPIAVCPETTKGVQVLTNSNFENPEYNPALCQIPADWGKSNQKRSKICLTEDQYVPGLPGEDQSVWMYADPGYNYPGTCNQATCNDLGKCTWLAATNQCRFNTDDECHVGNPNPIYNEGQTLCWTNTNRVMWMEFNYDVSNLLWTVDETYFAQFAYKGSSARDMGVTMCYALGNCGQCVPRQGIYVTNPADPLDLRICKPAYGAPCSEQTNKCCQQAPVQTKCYPGNALGVSAVFTSNFDKDNWKIYSTPFTYNDELNNLRDAAGARHLHFGVKFNYGNSGTGTDVYIDEFKIIKIALDCDDNVPTIYVGQSENCSNNIDDDCDSQIDCADADCTGDPAC